jgi:glycosyltransferase involved in cell wall biosynthesis
MQRNFLASRSIASLVRKATDVVAINEVVKNAICNVCKIDGSSIIVIENGIDTERFLPARRGEAREVRIVWLGRLHPDKNVLAALWAFREAVKTCKVNMRFSIVGDGDERAKAQNFVVDNGLSRLVSFEGAVADPVGALQGADIFLMSSRTEGTPLALLEAMSCGLPVVATAVGGIPSIVSEEIGRLTCTGDVGGMARSLVTLAEDRQLRLSMGRAARKLVENQFSEQRMAEKYIKLITNTDRRSARRG